MAMRSLNKAVGKSITRIYPQGFEPPLKTETATVQAAGSGEKMLNLIVLQRLDPYIQEILLNAGHVTIYDYNNDLTQMSRKDVDGSLFVVKRNAQPRFQFIVMNRQNTENLIVDLLDNFEYEVQHPYLIYRNATRDVNGLMFYNPRQCDEVANLFRRIVGAYGMNLSKRQRRKRKRISDWEKLKNPMKGVNFRKSKHDYQNVKESTINIGHDASRTGMHVHLLQASASTLSTSSQPPSVIPSQSPFMKVPFFPMSTPSVPHDQNVKNILWNPASTGIYGQAQQASASTVPTSYFPSVNLSQSFKKFLSLPKFTPSASHNQNVKESAMNIGSSASSTGISGQPQQDSASASPKFSHPPSVIPSQSPIMKVPSLPMSTPSVLHDQNVEKSAMNFGSKETSTGISGQLQQASGSAVPISSHPSSVIPSQSPITKLQSLPKSPPSTKHGQNVKESTMNIECNASSTGISGELHQASASASPTASPPPTVIPAQSPIMKVPSFPMSTPSVLLLNQNVEEAAMNIGSHATSTEISGQLQQASVSAVPISSQPPSVIPSQSSIMKLQSLPMSPPSAKQGQNVKSAINIGSNTSSAGIYGQPQQDSASASPTSSHPPSVIPSQSPIMKVPSLPMLTPSVLHDQNVEKSALNIGSTETSTGISGQLQQASVSAVTISSHPPSVIPSQSPIVTLQSLPMSPPSAKHSQNVKESAMNIGSNASSTGISGHPQQDSASASSHPPSVIPLQSPIIEVLSLPMSTPSILHNQNVEEAAMNIGRSATSSGISGQLQQDSASAVPISSHPPSVILSQSPIMKVGSFPISPPSAKHDQNVKESAMNIGCNASSTGISEQLHQGSASAAPTSSRPPGEIPLQSPIMNHSSLPMSTPSTLPDQIVEESAMNIRCNASSTGMFGRLHEAAASAVPTSSHHPIVFPLQSPILKFPSLPMSNPSAPHNQNMEESTINSGYNASSSGMSGQLYQDFAWSVPTPSLPPSVTPSRSPMKALSLPMSTPSALQDQNENKSTTGYNASSTGLSAKLQQASALAVPTSSSGVPFPGDASETILSNRDNVMLSFSVPTSSPTHLAPPILSTLPTPAHPPLAMQRFFGAPLLQAFEPAPAPSLTSDSTAPSSITLTKQNVQEALLTLVQDRQFVDMVYQALQKAHPS